MTIFYVVKFIDSVRLMTTSLANLVDNLIEEIHNTKCNDCFLENESFKIKY